MSLNLKQDKRGRLMIKRSIRIRLVRKKKMNVCADSVMDAIARHLLSHEKSLSQLVFRKRKWQLRRFFASYGVFVERKAFKVILPFNVTDYIDIIMRLWMLRGKNVSEEKAFLAWKANESDDLVSHATYRAITASEKGDS